MPRGDGTGPIGMGPMTGRAAGYCAGFGTPGFANPVPRMGMGFRRGAGFGAGYGFYGRRAGFARGAGFGGGYGRGYGNFGRGRGFRGRAAPFVPWATRAPVYPTYNYPTYTYGTPYRYPTYQAQPANRIW